MATGTNATTAPVLATAITTIPADAIPAVAIADHLLAAAVYARNPLVH